MQTTEFAYKPEDVAFARSVPTKTQTLRWWPAAILLTVMFALPWLPKLFESPPLPLLMASFMGPGLVGVLCLVWWVFASRAELLEKIIGLVGVLLIASVTIALLHKSMQGMGALISVIPSGAKAFAIPLILLAALPKYRLPVALISSVLAFGFWDLIQSQGVTGSFVSELDWRWRPTPEQDYLESLANRPQSTSDASPENSSPISLASAQWPSFRGPHRDGSQPGIVLEENWVTSPPKLIWQAKIGPAWSSFAVAGGRLFTQEQRGENEAVVCLDAETGAALWDYEYPSRFWEAVAGAGPRATPTIADEGLFALGGNGIMVCLNPQSGEAIWQVDLKKDAQREPPMWGFSASPLVVNGLVIVHAGGKENLGVLAYGAIGGELKWSVPSGDHSYSSPQMATFDDVTGILMETNVGLQFLDIATGQTLWNHDWPIQNYRALQPQVIGNTVLLAASLGGGTRSLNVSREGQTWNIAEAWTSRDMKPDFNDFVQHKGFVYGFDGNIFACIDLSTGKRKWKRGRFGNGQVLLLPDADQLLITSEMGELILLRADSEALVELARIQAIEGKTWNHPVLIANRVYVRNAEQAACYELAIKE